jgi:hypothetical protein
MVGSSVARGTGAFAGGHSAVLRCDHLINAGTEKAQHIPAMFVLKISGRCGYGQVCPSTSSGSDEFRVLPAEAGTFAERSGGFQLFATHQSRQLVYNQSSFQHPSEIYLLELEGSGPKPLSQFNAEVAAANQIRVDEVSFQLDENTIRTGYLIQPAGAEFPPQNVPIVVHHQGGPGGAMTNRWSHHRRPVQPCCPISAFPSCLCLLRSEDSSTSFYLGCR